MKSHLLSLCAAAATLLAFAPPAAQAAGGHLQIVDRVAGSDGGWDYVSYDAARGRIYVSHGKTVMSLDTATNKLNDHFADGAGLHAIVPVPGTDVLVTTNSGDSTVKLIKASDGSLIKSLPVGDDADGAAYDPATKLVVVENGDAGVLTLIDARKQAVVGTITVGDHLEFGRPDGKGRWYVNVADKGQVAVVDLVARKAIGRYDMAGCQRPTGLAFVEGNRVISSCNGMAKILDAATGHEIASLTIGGFPDSVIYDPARHVAYIPTAVDGKLWTIALEGPQNNTIADSVATQQGTRTGAVDEKTGRVYLPAAQFEPATPPARRPSVKAGSFQILVLDRK